jgi:hypothetical protein
MSAPQPGRIVADCAEDVRAILTHLGISRAAAVMVCRPAWIEWCGSGGPS